MPHQRSRHLLSLIQKRMKLWPVLALLGPRQVGKSTLLRNQLASSISAQYITFDDKDARDRANKRPNQFLTSFETKHLILDEVQKAPDLFDAIKVLVDMQRTPGRFILSGSTEFSKKTGIRESLTGRIGLFKMYPLTLAETLGQNYRNPWVTGKPLLKKSTVIEINKRITNGGMPGICFLHSLDERSASWNSWLDTTCYRDLQQIKGAQLSGDLASQILTVLAQTENPTIAFVAGKLKQDSRRVKSHIEALEALFVLNRLNPHPLGIGKNHYYLCDSGLAKHLGANEEIQFKTWVLCECFSQFESSGIKTKFYYYRSSNNSIVDLVIENTNNVRGIIFSHEESPNTYTLRTAEAFINKMPTAHAMIYAPSNNIYQETKKITLIPWGYMA